ncbi:MAG: ferrochelatase, partial [Planctomycetales bacterium]|nr:ferrochelatase [Planctomycetales bacterium]
MPTTGVLLVNLGSPDAPTPEALRPFLREFLSDPRVIPGAAWKRWLLLNLIILPFRPRLSAARYARIWDPASGMPLIHHARRLGEALAPLVADVGPVAVGMRYGRPPLAGAAADLLRRGAERLLVVPLFPQTSGATTGAVEDAVAAFVGPLGRDLPVRLLPAYHTDPGYLDAVAASVREDFARLGWEPERLLVSFHGIPRSMADAGDPYPREVEQTVEALRARLPLPRDRVLLVWQSRFGPA